MEGLELLHDLAVVLLIAGLAGWIARRLGLSAVVGYLVAGLVIGPHTPPFSLVLDEAQVRTLAQLGLVFLMFAMGMELSVSRLRRLGAPLVIATALGALIVLNVCRAIGLFAGWTHAEILCVTGMLIVSSSAVISKLVMDFGLAHERVGQLAMGITLLEDGVAVAMLAYIGTLGGPDAAGTAPVVHILAIFAGFVALVLILGLIVVPRVLRPAMRHGGLEIVTLLLAGGILGLAVLAVRAGYSVALGAFLLGAIVAEGPFRARVRRAFSGLKNTFTGVFFVAVGMMIAPRLLVENAGWILGLSAFALVARPIACSAALLAVGTPFAVAVRAALCLTAIGELSLVIAEFGVSKGVLDARFPAIAVGVTVVTALGSLGLARWGEGMALALEARQPRAIRAFLASWADWLGAVEAHGRSSAVWRMVRGRLIQVGVEVLLVSGLFEFSPAIREMIAGWVSPRSEHLAVFHALFWAGLVLVVAGPLLAIWRNVSVLTMVAAEMATNSSDHPRARAIFETALRTVAAVSMGMWLWTVFPFYIASPHAVAFSAAVFVFILAFFGRRLSRWHRQVELAVHEALGHLDRRGHLALGARLEQAGEWNIHLEECELPDHAACAGKNLAELNLRRRFGCTVVRIERQGFVIPRPSPATEVFPGDHLLLAGTESQIAEARAALGDQEERGADDGETEALLQSLRVPDESPHLGQSLADLAPLRVTGVQVLGIRRTNERIVNPSGEETLCAGDELLVLGEPSRVQRFAKSLRQDSSTG